MADRTGSGRRGRADAGRGNPQLSRPRGSCPAPRGLRSLHGGQAAPCRGLRTGTNNGPRMSSQKALAETEPASPLGNPRPQVSRRRLWLVTGLAGAGRSTALKCLEDHGFEAVDTLPLALLPHLVSGVNASGEAPRGPEIGSLAIGIDGRTRDFTAEGLAALLLDMKRDPALDVR